MDKRTVYLSFCRARSKSNQNLSTDLPTTNEVGQQHSLPLTLIGPPQSFRDSSGGGHMYNNVGGGGLPVIDEAGYASLVGKAAKQPSLPQEPLYEKIAEKATTERSN